MKICGVVNTRGRPCQRTGYCPFHHRYASVRRDGSIASAVAAAADDDDIDDDGEITNVTTNNTGMESNNNNTSDSATASSSSLSLSQQQQQQQYNGRQQHNAILRGNAKDHIQGVKVKRYPDLKSVQMQISILLIAAAAMDRKDLEENEKQKLQLKQQHDAVIIDNTTTTNNNNNMSINTLSDTSARREYFSENDVGAKELRLKASIGLQKYPAQFPCLNRHSYRRQPLFCLLLARGVGVGVQSTQGLLCSCGEL